MTRPHRNLLPVIIATLAGVATALAIAFSTVPPAVVIDEFKATPSASELAIIQETAERACKCTRSNGAAGQDKCWKEYEWQVRNLQRTSEASACAPVSTRVDCFGPNGTAGCVVTGYHLTETDHHVTLCNPEEAKAVENAFMKSFRASGSEAASAEPARTNEAVGKVIDQIRSGTLTDVSASAEGCI